MQKAQEGDSEDRGTVCPGPKSFQGDGVRPGVVFQKKPVVQIFTHNLSLCCSFPTGHLHHWRSDVKILSAADDSRSGNGNRPNGFSGES